MRMAELTDPETPPRLDIHSTLKTFEHLYELILSGDVKGVSDHLEQNQIMPESYRTLVKDRYFPSLRYSPVATAARTGQVDIMKTLIAHGFSPEETSRNLTGKNEYPIHLACAANQVTVVKTLIEDFGVCVDSRDSGDSTPIFWAILTENMEMLKLLVGAGADINNTFHETMTPLLFAAFMISSPMCEYLISNGANVNAVGDCGNTPLCLSLRDVYTSKMLIDAGADVNHVNSQGETAFILATKRNYRNTVELLVSCGADVNFIDHLGRTALHHAVDREFNTIAEFLIVDVNVKLEKKDNQDRTPFYLAFYLRNFRVVELLVEAGVDPGREPVVFENDPSDRLIPEWFAIVKMCRFRGRNARRLEQLCMHKLRCLFGQNLQESLSSLPLPLILKEEIRLQFLKEPHCS